MPVNMIIAGLATSAAVATDWRWIGAALKERREQLGKSQQWVAERCEMTRAQISHIENGRSVPPLSTVERIAEVLKWEVELRLGPASSGSLDTAGLPRHIRDAVRTLVESWTDNEVDDDG